MKYSKIKTTRPIYILTFDGGLTINYGKRKLLNEAWSKQYTNPDKHCTAVQPKQEYVLLDKYKMGNR